MEQNTESFHFCRAEPAAEYCTPDKRLSKRKEASGSPFAEAEDESSAFEYSTPAQQSKRRNQQFRCNDLWTAKGSRIALPSEKVDEAARRLKDWGDEQTEGPDRCDLHAEIMLSSPMKKLY